MIKKQSSIKQTFTFTSKNIIATLKVVQNFLSKKQVHLRCAQSMLFKVVHVVQRSQKHAVKKKAQA